MSDQKDDQSVVTPRRGEILTGSGARRHWSEAMKAQIVLEAMQPGVVITELARRYGAQTSQVHTWRKDAREGRLILPAVPAAAFAEVVVASSTPAVAHAKAATKSKHPSNAEAVIELDAGDMHIRVRAGTDPALVHAIVRAIKGAS